MNDEVEFWDVINSRRSIRQFNSQPVSKSILEKIISGAVRAPNAHNRQPWRFLVLVSESERLRLAETMSPEYRKALTRAGLTKNEIEKRISQRTERTTKAPVAIVPFYVSDDMNRYPEDAEREKGEDLMGIQSVAIASGYLLLAAEAEGLKGVWTCAPLFVMEEVRSAFTLPDSWHPQALLLLGYSDEEPIQKERKSLEDVVVCR